MQVDQTYARIPPMTKELELFKKHDLQELQTIRNWTAQKIRFDLSLDHRYHGDSLNTATMRTQIMRLRVRNVGDVQKDMDSLFAIIVADAGTENRLDQIELVRKYTNGGIGYVDTISLAIKDSIYTSFERPRSIGYPVSGWEAHIQQGRESDVLLTNPNAIAHRGNFDVGLFGAYVYLEGESLRASTFGCSLPLKSMILFPADNGSWLVSQEQIDAAMEGV